MKSPMICVLTVVLIGFVCGFAQAQASRTWVSGGGDDANPCSRTAPCKTFAGAISKTAAGGEIDALDPGGYGAVTIVKAMVIDGGGGQVASTLVSGTNGIVVSAGVSDVVTLRNLSINGIGSGLSAVKFLSGKALHIEHCKIANFINHGIDIEPGSNGGSIFVDDTTSQDNGGSGLLALASSTYVQVSIDNSRFDNNMFGVSAEDFTRFSVRNSAASGNSQVGFLVQANSGTVLMSLASSTAGNNNIGVKSGGGTAASSVRLAGVSLFLNVTGLLAGTNGTIASFGNNYNSGSGSPNASLPQQ